MVISTKAAVSPAKEIVPAAFSMSIYGKKHTDLRRLKQQLLPKFLFHHNIMYAIFY